MRPITLTTLECTKNSWELNPPLLAVDPERFYRFGEKGMIASYGRDAQRTEAFLPFRGSRPGLFCDLSARETCPLRCSPAPVEREPGLPPQISHEKTAPSHQSLQKSLCPLHALRGGLLSLTLCARTLAGGNSQLSTDGAWQEHQEEIKGSIELGKKCL